MNYTQHSNKYILDAISSRGAPLQTSNKSRRTHRSISVSDVKFNNSKCLSKLKSLMSEDFETTDIIIEVNNNHLSIRHRKSGTLNLSIDGNELSYIEICKFLSEHTGISINKMLINGMHETYQMSDTSMTYKNQRFRISIASIQPKGGCIVIRRISKLKSSIIH